MNYENQICSDCSKHEDQLVRLRKVEGQVKGIQKMIKADRYCIDILMQIKSVKNALAKVEENILKKHIETCIHDAMQSGSQNEKETKITELMQVISKFT